MVKSIDYLDIGMKKMGSYSGKSNGKTDTLNHEEQSHIQSTSRKKGLIQPTQKAARLISNVGRERKKLAYNSMKSVLS